MKQLGTDRSLPCEMEGERAMNGALGYVRSIILFRSLNDRDVKDLGGIFFAVKAIRSEERFVEDGVQDALLM